MKLSLAHYNADKIVLKFGNSWMRTGDRLYHVRSIDTDLLVGKLFRHLFAIDVYTGSGAASLKNPDEIKTVNDLEFERIYSDSVAFPRTGLTNIYDPCSNTLYGVLRLCYDATNGESKYKRACFSEALKEMYIVPKSSGELSSAISAIENVHIVAQLTDKVESINAHIKAKMFNLSKIWSAFFPRYDFLNADNVVEMQNFFKQNTQVMLSPLFRAAKINHTIVLFADHIPCGIYSNKGCFMLKEQIYSTFKKELELARIPITVHKRLIRSSVVLL